MLGSFAKPSCDKGKALLLVFVAALELSNYHVGYIPGIVQGIFKASYGR